MITKCLFPVAGHGTRFLPATKTVPKEMLPLLDRPLIHYGVQEAADTGIRNMLMVTGRSRKTLEDYFDQSPELEPAGGGGEQARRLAEVRRLTDSCTFMYTRQMQANGLGHAVLTGQPLVGNEPFAVILPDDICWNQGPAPLQQLMDIYARHECTLLALQEVKKEQTGNYGIVSGSEEAPGLFRIHDLVEKPHPDAAPSRLAVVGRYLLTPDIFDLLRQTPPDARGEIQLTDALRQQARAGRVLGCRFQGRRFDCGTVPGMLEAGNFFFEKVYRGP